jgi:radical SAM enzyme (TIGR01210 family)
MHRFPDEATARDRFILERREPRATADPWATPSFVLEHERDRSGRVSPVITIFLVGKECAWRCTMCDLWRQTSAADTPVGAIPRQVESAWSHRAAECGTVKLYNAGSFFDPRAVPDADYVPIVKALACVRHVVVESHPSLVGLRTTRLRDLLRTRDADDHDPATLEVAMGLETCHPEALGQLNKRMTLSDFERAAERLHEGAIALRTFLLISPPFVPREVQDEWLCRSIDAAVSCRSAVISLIPTRSGNGAIDALAHGGDFVAPRLIDIERSLTLALNRVQGSGTRVFADVWDVARFAECGACLQARKARLELMNHTQSVAVPVRCAECASGSA